MQVIFFISLKRTKEEKTSKFSPLLFLIFYLFKQLLKVTGRLCCSRKIGHSRVVLFQFIGKDVFYISLYEESSQMNQSGFIDVVPVLASKNSLVACVAMTLQAEAAAQLLNMP